MRGTPRFNPPPGWPKTRQKWSADWRPDPGLPPAPYGWPFWVRDTGLEPHGLGIAIAVTLLLGATVVYGWQTGQPLPWQSLLFVGVLVAAVVIGATRGWARRRVWAVVLSAVFGLVAVGGAALGLYVLMHL